MKIDHVGAGSKPATKDADIALCVPELSTETVDLLIYFHSSIVNYDS
jgi:hypothetical protein